MTKEEKELLKVMIDNKNDITPKEKELLKLSLDQDVKSFCKCLVECNQNIGNKTKENLKNIVDISPNVMCTFFAMFDYMSTHDIKY